MQWIHCELLLARNKCHFYMLQERSVVSRGGLKLTRELCRKNERYKESNAIVYRSPHCWKNSSQSAQATHQNPSAIGSSVQPTRRLASAMAGQGADGWGTGRNAQQAAPPPPPNAQKQTRSPANHPANAALQPQQLMQPQQQQAPQVRFFSFTRLPFLAPLNWCSFHR